MSEELSTPFAKWIEEGKEDPHGNTYNKDYKDLAMGQYPSVMIALSLIVGETSKQLGFIAWLTAGKERLRWLSRKLYRLTSDYDEINQRRSQLLRGNLTDDELANEFYLSESKEDLKAGHDRIMWLLDEVNKLENNEE